MKYLKKYNENQEQQDPEFAIAKIKDRFHTEVVEEMYSKEKVEWTPEDKDGVWYEKGEMGWFGMVSDEKEQSDWNIQVAGMIELLDDETLISIYDCHI